MLRLRLHNGLVYLAQKPPLQPLSEEQLFEKYHQEKDSFLHGAEKAFYDLVPTLLEIGLTANGEATSKKAAGELFLQNTRSDLGVRRFLNEYGLGQDSAILKRFSDIGVKAKKADTIWNSLRRLLESTYIEHVREEAKAPLRKVGLPPEIVKELLPAPFSFEIGPSGRIVREFSVFGNKLKTEEKKSRAMAKLLDQWTDLTTRLNHDIESADPITRLSALVASIIVYTGIRPGAGGESKLKDDFGKIVRDDEGNPIRVPTVGATGLRPEHIQFLRDDYARLEFTGKAGTKNIAELSDPNLVRALKAQIALAKKDSSGLAFVTDDGRRVTPKDVNSYLQTILGPSIVATDFRKLRATQAFYDAIREREDELADELRGLKEEASASVEQQVISTILGKLEDAAKEAQRAISHTDVRTTIESYISPRVVLSYLTNAGLPDALDSVIGEGRNLKVKFDPYDFYEKVSGESLQAVASVLSRVATTMFSDGSEFVKLSIDELLEDLEGEP